MPVVLLALLPLSFPIVGASRDVSVIVKKQFENIFVARYLQKLNANAVRVRIPWKLVQQVSFIHIDLQTQRGRDKRTQF